MTAAQESYLSTLAHEAGQDVPDNLTKAQALRRGGAPGVPALVS